MYAYNAYVCCVSCVYVGAEAQLKVTQQVLEQQIQEIDVEVRAHV